MKKIIGIALGLLLCAGAVSPVMAQNLLESSLQEVAAEFANRPYLRYYTYDHTSDLVNPGGEFSCPNWDPPFCGPNYKAKKTGYRAYQEVVSNFDDAPTGTIVAAVWDLELGTGADRTGYYGFGAAAESVSNTMLWDDPNCTGDIVATCIGPFSSSYSSGSDVANAPGGPLAPQAGLRPIPVPLVDSGADPIVLSWDAVVGQGAASSAEVQYDILFATDDTSDGSCTARSGSFSLLRTVSGNTTNVAYSDVGGTAGDPTCVAFAIQLRYPPTGGSSQPILSRYLSRAGQAVQLDNGATAAEVYDLAAARAGNLSVEVSWKTSLENGVVGFYVTRALTENGPFARVSDLIPAKGEPSAYSFVDTYQGQIQGRVRFGGLFYKVESVDIDDEIIPFGPVKADLGGAAPGNRRIFQRTR